MKKILVIQTAFIGDVILATSLLETLHVALSGSKIDVLVRKGNEPLFKNHPFLNKVLVWNKASQKYRNLARLLPGVRRTKYDWVINLQRFATTGLFTALSGAPKKTGFDKNPFSFFYSHKTPHQIGLNEHEVDRNFKLIQHLVNHKQRLAPKLYPDDADFAKVASYKNQEYVCIAPTSVWFTKQAPAEIWMGLLRFLTPGYHVYLLGSPSDFKACEMIRQSSETARITNLAGKLSLLESAALMKDARMNYVNDSAPMHLASAMDAPTTAVFCSTVPEFGFGPLAGQSKVVQTREQLDCKPCGLHGKSACPLSHFKCGHTIQIQDLMFEA